MIEAVKEPEDLVLDLADYWSANEAFLLCQVIEAVAPKHGFHIGLTGGCLYKGGLRKDVDIVLYRIRQEKARLYAFYDELATLGIERKRDHGFVTKCEYRGKTIDFLYPEINSNPEEPPSSSY